MSKKRFHNNHYTVAELLFQVSNIKKTFTSVTTKPIKRGTIEIIIILRPTNYSNAHPKSAIQIRNRAMVNRSDLCVFCVTHKSGGAYQTLRYAEKADSNIINLRKRFYFSLTVLHFCMRKVESHFFREKQCS